MHAYVLVHVVAHIIGSSWKLFKSVLSSVKMTEAVAFFRGRFYNLVYSPIIDI